LRKICAEQNKNMKNRLLLIMSALVLSVGTMYGATAAKGVFTVAEGKTVQFANAIKAAFVQWSTANAWREDQKNAEGHNGWFVLDHNEWTYLLTSGRTNAANLNNIGIVDGKKGLIILPDGWAQPAGVPVFKPVDQGIVYANNTYTAEQWSTMADAGAIFLPCEGYKEGDVIKDPTDHGAYWSSDPCSESNGYSVHFNEGEIHDCNTYASKDLYYSVILVRETPAPVEEIILDEMDESAAYAEKWTAAKVNSFAYVRRTLKKDGTFYTLCLPFDVPNIDDTPLAGAEVFTFDGGTVSGTTGNEVLNLNLSTFTGKRLTQGVPYILRWTNTGETLETPLLFANVENWDDDTNAGADQGNEIIKYHGMYPRAHIDGYQTGEEAHYNFFMGANNTLYWPDDKLYPNSKLKGFRAYFYIVHTGSGEAPVRQGTQAVWKISNGLGSATGVQNTEYRIQTEKLLQDGQIILIINGEQYTIGGQKL